MKIILASNSPRRRELLKKAGFDFTVIPSDFEEGENVGLSPEKYTEYLGKILSQNHGLTSAKNDTACASTWNAYLEEYKNKKKQMEDSK
jgi:septum formation protein